MELPETNNPGIAGETRKRRSCLYYLLLLALGIVSVVVLVIVLNMRPEGQTQNLFSQLVSDPTVIWIAVISFVVAAVIFVIAEIIAKKKK